MLLWLTWPEVLPTAAGLGVLAFLAAAVLHLGGHRTFALLLLAIGAASSVLLPADALDWRAWLAALLLAWALDGALRAGKPATPRVWTGVGVMVGGLLALGIAARVWRPLRDSLQGEAGTLVAILVLAAIGISLVLTLRSSDDEDDAGAA